MKTYLALLGAAAIFLGGCSRNIQNQEAVLRGVKDYLGKRGSIDVNSMDVSIASVSFRENEADAMVSFRPKGSTDASAGMQMSYTLERKGNEWVVKGRSGKGGANPHGMGGETPVGHGTFTVYVDGRSAS